MPNKENLLNNSQPKKLSLSGILGNTNNTLEYKTLEGLPEIVTLVTTTGYRSYKTPQYAETAEGRVYNYGDIKNYKNSSNTLNQAPAFLVQIANYEEYVMLSKENFDKYKGIFLEKEARINAHRATILAKIESVKKTDSYKALEVQEHELPREYSVDRLYASLPDTGLDRADVKASLGIQ